jgi:hypothetical protein
VLPDAGEVVVAIGVCEKEVRLPAVAEHHRNLRFLGFEVDQPRGERCHIKHERRTEDEQASERRWAFDW